LLRRFRNWIAMTTFTALEGLGLSGGKQVQAAE
jgi:hypothetical protein